MKKQGIRVLITIAATIMVTPILYFSYRIDPRFDHHPQPTPTTSPTPPTVVFDTVLMRPIGKVKDWTVFEVAAYIDTVTNQNLIP